MPHITAESHSYATYDNAIKELDRALALIERSRFDGTRWLISIVPTEATGPQASGNVMRYVPCIIAVGPHQSEYLRLLHVAKVCLIG